MKTMDDAALTDAKDMQRIETEWEEGEKLGTAVRRFLFGLSIVGLLAFLAGMFFVSSILVGGVKNLFSSKDEVVPTQINNN